MANQEHLDLLKQGVEAWNQWRRKYPSIQPDLSSADLSNVNLSQANLSRTDLSGVYLLRANLSSTDLSSAYLTRAHLSVTDLRAANLHNATFIQAYLRNADLRGADLSDADLYGVDLRNADLSGAHLNNTHFSRAILGGTILGDVNLRFARELETVIHRGPSYVSIDTIYRSQGRISEKFLRGTGVPEEFITYIHSLVNRPVEYSTCFISYSSKDQDFAERIYTDLQSKGVRCWFAFEDLKIGDKLRHRIDESIRLYDKLLLVFSEHSVASQWVEQEVETALAKERKEGRTVLFPIRLDSTVMGMEGGWPALIRNTRHIGDFTYWKEHDAYQKGLKRLLHDLKAGA